MDKEIIIRASIKLSDDASLSLYQEKYDYEILKMTPWHYGVGHGTTSINKEQAQKLIDALNQWILDGEFRKEEAK